jgi:hypothetical protein
MGPVHEVLTFSKDSFSPGPRHGGGEVCLVRRFVVTETHLETIASAFESLKLSEMCWEG